MEQFYPSEIARLVLGYLKKECPAAANIFEAESGSLNEYRLLKIRNKNPKTTVHGMTLVDFFDRYCSVTSHIKLPEITRRQTTLDAEDVTENSDTIAETLSETNFDQNELSVIYDSGINNLKDKKIKIESEEQERCGSEIKDKIKIKRLTRKQEKKLNNIFQKKNYIRIKERRYISKKLGTSEMQVKFWFQKKRDSLRRQFTAVFNDSNDVVDEPRPSPSDVADEININQSCPQLEASNSLPE